jgi:putative endonuclease
MPYTVYILHSDQLNKFYLGKTSLKVEEGLAYHLKKHKGFTSLAKDWKIIHSQQLDSKSEALLLEKKIKKRGAKICAISLGNSNSILHF